MIMAPLLSYIILTHGWRNGAICAGLMILAIAIPAALPIKRSPEDLGLRPDGQPIQELTPESLHPGSPPATEINFTVRQGLRTLPFWLLMAAISLRLSVTVALNTHFVPLLVWRGMGEAASAYMVSLYALVSIPMTLALGWMGDHWDKARLCSVGTIPTLVAMLGMIFFRGSATLYFFPIAFAITMASTSLNWALIGDYFGRTRYATLRGIMGVGYGVATFFSPIFAGLIFDRTESYDLVLWTFSAILAVAATLFALLRHPLLPRSKERDFGTR
jgi:cyanate permease